MDIRETELDQAVQREQLSAVCASLPQAMGISVIVAALLAGVQSIIVPALTCWSWFAAIVAVNLSRILLLPRARREKNIRTQFWVHRLELLTMLAGAVWGLSALIMLPPGHPEHHMYLALVLAGMVMGTVITFSALFRAAIGFMLLTMLPMLVLFSLSYDTMHHAVAAGGLVFLLGAINGVYRLNRGDRQLIGARLKAEKAERVKDEFIANMNHELRTPLTSIVGSLQILNSGHLAAVPAQLKRLVGIADESAKRMTDLVNDLLDMEAISQRGLNINLQRIMLGDVISTALHCNAGYAERYAVTFVEPGPMPDAVVSADRSRLLQILTNLLTNAAKFSPTGGKVTVSTYRNGDRIRIDVADQGPGIPVEFRQRIFTRFSQAESGTARQRGGTGLGLCISKSLADAMDMQLGFDSKPGQGSVFHLDMNVERWAGKTGTQDRSEEPVP